MIELKSVRELLGMKFFIPSYQRGYRWTEQQVKDLLEDIWEFSKKKKNEYEFYCVQPLVVKQMDESSKDKFNLGKTEEWYEVIDGQQRLTTIFLILSVLGQAISILGMSTDLYELKYQREIKGYDFSEFLKNVSGISDVEQGQIDYYHVSIAYLTIKKWLEDNNVNKGDFCNVLLKHELDDSTPQRDKANNIRFIWYESDEFDSVKVFTRLNIGKISLTNSELIKALFLNRSNFGGEDSNHLRLRQQEIASEWDNIEYTLQNDEFWLFLHENGYDRPTRIDFIFELICKQKLLGQFDNFGTDEYKTFRYFYEYFKMKNASVETCWTEVKKYFQTFEEWFNDLELYHYVGYLIEYKQSIFDLVEIWKRKNTKNDFVAELKIKIKNEISKCKDLNKQYEIKGSPKTQCRSLLLLHNIQTVIEQNKNFSNKEEYKLPVFYKFPFHLFKKENWDVEHIDSNTENDLSSKDAQNETLLNIYYSVDSTTQEQIKKFIDDPQASNFDSFRKFIIEPKDSLSDKEKDQICNYTLLDCSTNRSYGNSIFSAKRRIIIGKDGGRALPIPKIKKDNHKSEFVIGDIENAKTAFIPPCTKNVFLKYYTPVLTNYNYWTKPDAKAYKLNILEILKDFDVIDESIVNV